MNRYLAALTALLLLPCAALAATQSPEAGSYAASIYVASTNYDNYCLDYQGEQYLGQVSYSGFSGTTDYVRVPLTGADELVSSVQVLKITHGSGTTSPSGNLTWTGTSTNAQLWDVAGSFSATSTKIGSHTFLASVTEKYNQCVETLSISLVRMSADQ